MAHAWARVAVVALAACAPQTEQSPPPERTKRASVEPCALSSMLPAAADVVRCDGVTPLEIETDGEPAPAYEAMRQCILGAAQRRAPFVATWHLASREPIVLALAGAVESGGYVIHEVHHSTGGARRFTCSALVDLRAVCGEPKPAAPLTSLDVMRLEGCPADPARSATYRLRLELGCADETPATDCP